MKSRSGIMSAFACAGALALTGCLNDAYVCSGSSGEAKVLRDTESGQDALWLRTTWRPYGPDTVYHSAFKSGESDKLMAQAKAYCASGQVPEAF